MTIRQTSIGFTLPMKRSPQGGYFDKSHDMMTQIKSNFINLISTMKGERMSNPEFGCDVHAAVFNFNDDDLGGFAGENRGSRSGQGTREEANTRIASSRAVVHTSEQYKTARRSIEDAVARWMPFIELDKFEILTTNNDKDNSRTQIYMSYVLVADPLQGGETMQQFGSIQ